MVRAYDLVVYVAPAVIFDYSFQVLIFDFVTFGVLRFVSLSPPLATNPPENVAFVPPPISAVCTACDSTQFVFASARKVSF